MGRLVGWLEDTAHFPIFAFLAASLFALGADRAGGWRGSAVVGGAALGLAVLVEIVQPMVGRTAGWRDIAFAAAGVAFAIACRSSCRAGMDGRARLIFASLAAALAAGALAPLALVALDRRRARMEFPMLADFRSPQELGRWRAQGCRMTFARPEGSASMLKIEVADDTRYPGAFMTDFPRDWRAFPNLRMDIVLPGRYGKIVWIRVDDQPGSPPYEERIQEPVALVPGTNRIWLGRDKLSTTPSGRAFDLGSVVTWGIFFDRGHKGDLLYMDRVRLSSDEK